MEKKIVNVLLCIIFSTFIKTQNETGIIRPGLISGRLTLSPSYFSYSKTSLFYLHGNLEGRLDKAVSLSGDGYFYLGSSGLESGVFRHHHAGFFGLLFHETNKNNDFFIGFQPGLVYTELKPDTLNPSLKKTHASVNALFSVYTGYNLYFFDYFHFFIHVSYRYGLHAANLSVPLNEFIFSAGLGFHINTIKKSS